MFTLRPHAHLIRLPLGEETEDNEGDGDEGTEDGIFVDAKRLSSALTTWLSTRKRAKVERARNAGVRLGRDHLGVGGDGSSDGGGGELAERVGRVDAGHLRHLEGGGGAKDAGEEELLHCAR